MKKLLYTDKPEIRSGYDQDAGKLIRVVLVVILACFLLTAIVAAFAGIDEQDAITMLIFEMVG